MHSSTDKAVARVCAPLAKSGRHVPLCLIVNDDLQSRLKLADLVRGTGENLDANTVTAAGLARLRYDELRAYAAVLVIVQFSSGDAADPLAIVARLRAQAPRLPIFIFARGGDERAAARAIKLGANDYWPVHSIDSAELARALRPHVAPASGGDAVPCKPDWHATPEIAGYRLLKRIAQSAAATVFLARHDSLAQQVALKVQSTMGNTSVSDADRQRFTRECEILSSLNHRAIADVLDFGITPNYLYLALEYFPCGSMRERLKNPVSEADAVNYARQIAEALQVVHAAGVVHGDLKPSNLMLTTDNRVVLIDFGSARAQLVAREKPDSELHTGTPYYVCPEEIQGKAADARGDLYSLGIVFYEMLAGSVPFHGARLSDIFEAHKSAAVPALGAPLMRYQFVINRLLAKQPADRFVDAADFLQALSAVGETQRSPGRRNINKGAPD